MAILKFENINHWLVARFNTPRLTDPMTVATVEAALMSKVRTLPTRCQVAVSFSGVEYVSSQVIGLLLGLKGEINRRHGTLVLCKLSKHVVDIMRVTRLDRQFTISDSLSAIVGKRKVALGKADDVEWVD